MLFRQEHSLQAAAAKAGFSTATAYQVEADPQLPSTNNKRRGGALAVHSFLTG